MSYQFVRLVNVNTGAVMDEPRITPQAAQANREISPAGVAGPAQILLEPVQPSRRVSGENGMDENEAREANNQENVNGSRQPVQVPQDGESSICAVCGDIATGVHYKVLSCEGCKAVLKRNKNVSQKKSKLLVSHALDDADGRREKGFELELGVFSDPVTCEVFSSQEELQKSDIQRLSRNVKRRNFRKKNGGSRRGSSFFVDVTGSPESEVKTVSSKLKLSVCKRLMNRVWYTYEDSIAWFFQSRVEDESDLAEPLNRSLYETLNPGICWLFWSVVCGKMISMLREFANPICQLYSWEEQKARNALRANGFKILVVACVGCYFPDRKVVKLRNKIYNLGMVEELASPQMKKFILAIRVSFSFLQAQRLSDLELRLLAALMLDIDGTSDKQLYNDCINSLKLAGDRSLGPILNFAHCLEIVNKTHREFLHNFTSNYPEEAAQLDRTFMEFFS